MITNCKKKWRKYDFSSKGVNYSNSSKGNAEKTLWMLTKILHQQHEHKSAQSITKLNQLWLWI